MKALRVVLRIPLLVVILYLGSTTLFESIRFVRSFGIAWAGWDFWLVLLEGLLEITVLVWLYRYLESGVGLKGTSRLSDRLSRWFVARRSS